MVNLDFIWWVAALAFATPLIFSAAGTPMMLRWARRQGRLDRPNDRSSHTVETPYGAGVPVMAGILVVLAVYPLAVPLYGNQGAIVYIPLLGSLVLALVSWADDIYKLGAWPRLLAQAVVVIGAILTLPLHIVSVNFGVPTIVLQVGLILGWIWFINLYNFMDGIDGITGVETLCIGLGFVAVTVIAVVQATGFFALSRVLPMALQLPLALALVGGVVGFLPFNWHPARIFMGDVGSVPIGYLIGWLMIVLLIAGQPAAAIILPLYYLVDATWTLTRRVARRQPPWRAHREHFYQRAAAARGHRRVSLAVLIADVLLIGCAAASLWLPWIALAAAFAVTLAIIVWMVMVRATEEDTPSERPSGDAS